MHLEERPLKFSKITHHASVTQCLGSIGGNVWYIGVAKPSIVDSSEIKADKGLNIVQSHCGHFYVPPAVDDVRVFRIAGPKFLKMNRGTWHAGPLFKADVMDFYNLELSNTNVVDHTTHNFVKKDNTDETANKALVCAGLPEKGDKCKQLKVLEWLVAALKPLKGKGGGGKGGLAQGQGSDIAHVEDAMEVATSFAVHGELDTKNGAPSYLSAMIRHFYPDRKSRGAAEFTWGILNFQKDQDIRLKVGYEVFDKRLASDFLSNYIFLAVQSVGSSTDLIVQRVEFVLDSDKRSHLMD